MEAVMGMPGIDGDRPRDVPEARQPLPGEIGKPFLRRWVMAVSTPVSQGAVPEPDCGGAS